MAAITESQNTEQHDSDLLEKQKGILDSSIGITASMKQAYSEMHDDLELGIATARQK